MPIMYVNPARRTKRRTANTTSPRKKVRRRKVRRTRNAKGHFVSVKKNRRVKRRIVRNITKGRSMAKKKRRKGARKSSTPRRRKSSTRRRKSSTSRRSTAARGRATRRRKARKLSAAIMLGLRKNKRRRRNAPRKRRRRNLLSYAQPNPGKRRRRRKNKARVSRRRRRNSYFTLKSNPRRRRRGRRMNRARRRYGRRRNPAIMSLLKQVAPIAAALYGARFLSGKVGDKIPGLDAIPEQFRGVAVAGLLTVGGHFATSKIAMLRKWREGIMIGLGINLIDKLLKAVAPDAAAMFGVSEYVAVGGLGYAPPLDDQLTMGEYVAVGDTFQEALGVEQDLGLEQDLGILQADLGDVGDNRLGGVSRSSMVAPVGQMKFLGPVPPRSFTAPVPGFNADFDQADSMYQGIFAGRDSYGGWGSGAHG